MKRKILIGFIGCLCLLFCFSVCVYGLSVTASEMRTLTVVLDAGHGGIDGGVVGAVTKTPESKINLAIVKKLQSCFENSGINCVLTRKTDAGLYALPTKGFKKRDMAKRKEIIDKADPVAVVSVHQNFYTGSSAMRGGQVFYRADNENGKALALGIQQMFNKINPPTAQRQIHAGDYYMLNCTDCASVIVECGFLSNAQDELLLITKEYQQTVAETIYEGVLIYLAQKANGV